MTWLLPWLLLPGVADAGKKKTPQAEGPGLATVELPCHFVPGAVYRYRIERSSTEDGSGGTPVVLRYAYDLRIEVVSYAKHRSVVAVRTGPTEVLEADPVVRGRFEALDAATAGRDLTARYATDHRTGAHVVENLDALVRAYAPVFDDPAVVQSIVESDASIPLEFGCTSFPVLPTTYDTELPDGFGMADSVAGTGRVWATEEEAGTWVIRKSEQSTPSAANAALRAYLEDTWEDDTHIDTTSLDVRGDLEVAVPLADGWATRWKVSSTSTVTSTEQTEPLARQADTIVATRLPDQSG